MRKRWMTAGAIAVGLAVYGAAVVILDAHRSGEVFFCEGIGLRGPSAPTPDDALAIQLRLMHGRLPDWKRSDRRTVKLDRSKATYEVVAYVPTRTPVRPAYSRIEVDNQRTTWRASGACVAPADTG